jgi:hypothetical protein
MKSRDINNLSYDETMLLERMQSIETSDIESIAYGLLDEGHRVFVDDIFLIVVQDVFRVLNIDSLDQKSYNKLMSFADNLWSTKATGCYGYPSNAVVALTMIWITYYTEYKDLGRVVDLNADVRGLAKSEHDTFYSMCETYFNMFCGPMNMKRRRFATYMFDTLGKDYFGKKNDNHTLNFLTLITLLDSNGLKYRAYEPITEKE